MAVTWRHLPDDREQVFAVLVTPETYPLWLVGCQDIRDVDDGWPAPGTSFHHRVGLAGPLTVADATTVLEVVEPERLVLEVRARPLGRGRVTFTLEETSDGGTALTVDEVPIGALAPARPVLDPVTVRRNNRSLAGVADYLRAQRAMGERQPVL
jgi:uncharacterized protein YndB with AHSA1/START domain